MRISVNPRTQFGEFAHVSGCVIERQRRCQESSPVLTSFPSEDAIDDGVVVSRTNDIDVNGRRHRAADRCTAAGFAAVSG